MKISKKKQQLAKMICTGGIVLSTSLMMAPAEAAITTSQDYDINSAATVTEDINIPSGHVKFYNNDTNYNTTSISFTGDVFLVQADNEEYALLAEGYDGASGGSATLNINPNQDKTVKIIGDVKAKANHNVSWGYSGTAVINLNLTNADSYFAGKMLLEGTDNKTIALKLKNGATWYVPMGDNTYDLSSGITLSADGGIIDLYHQTPTKVRSSVGDRTFALSNTGTSANGATFALSSDIANNTADSVNLSGVTGTNTYYVQVVHDDSQLEDGTYTGNAIVLTTDNASDTVTAKEYTTTKDVAAGLMSNTLTITPTLNTVGGVTKLTEVQIKTIAKGGAGPAQQMANAASTTSQASLSAWRAENNDLLRRMGDLRWDETNAGAWGRFYGGQSEINTALPSTVKTKGIQVGYDRQVPMEGGKLFTGIAISHMDGDLSSDGGNGDTDSTMFGVYGSYQGEKGHFIDAIVKYGRMSNQFTRNSTTALYESDTSANGLNMCLEYGYHKELKDNWYIEPQAEFSYGHINSNSYTMKMNGGSGANVSNDSVNSLIGRIGINYGKNTDKGNVYAKLSVAHEFSGDIGVTTSYGGYENHTSESMKDTWIEYGIGFNQKLNESNNLYGEITKTAGADKVTEKWKANIGFRHSF